MLTTEIARSGLQRLGRHPITQRHAFLEMILSAQQLSDIEEIRKFEFITILDISDNNIESLKPLESLPTLVNLNARSNRISDCLTFSAPLCDQNFAWTAGGNSAGSLLTVVDLSSNLITELGDLSRHRFLERLLLSRNQISRIEGLQGLTFLKELDLSYNKIKVIEGLDNLPIEVLNLRGNRIKHLSGLDKLQRLSHLDAAENRIASLEPLVSRKNLNHVDVGSNEIDFIRQAEFLQDIVWLKTLVMENNPCADKHLYRLRVLYRLPKLQMLDNTEASLEDKVRAFNLYHSPEGDLAMREEVLRKHVPSVPFVDYSPQQLPVDEEDAVTPRDLKRGVSVRPAARQLANQVYEGVFEELG